MLLFGFSKSYCQIITTSAGNGIEGYSGDGAAATLAEITLPGDIAFDSLGNYYFAERLNNIVRKVSFDGIISTVAGNGTEGFSGDGALATSAELDNPAGVACDYAGNLYIADLNNNRVRRVDAVTNVITTVAGTGTAGFAGDSGTAYTANLNSPSDVCLDRFHNLYILDDGNQRIRKVDAYGTITTFAGNGIYGYSGDGGLAVSAQIYPTGLVTDSVGNLFIADWGNARIRKVDIATQIISTYAGTGTALYNGEGVFRTSAQIAPFKVCFDMLGNLYFADLNNYRIRKIDDSGYVHTVAGNGIGSYSGDGGLAVDAEIYYPEGIGFSECNNLYIADEANNRIRKVTYNNTSVNILSATGDTICGGNSVSYIASVTSGGGTVSYQWFVNNVVVSTASSYAYIPVNGDAVKVVINTSNACSGMVSDTSNTIHMTVIAAITPSIHIIASADSICSGTVVTLTATPTYGGSSPTYEWIVDGSFVASGSTYTYTPANHDSVRALLTSDMACVTTTTASSNAINFAIQNVLVPSITISGPADVVEGGDVTFTATVTNAGTGYIIRWFDHGSPFYTGPDNTITFIKPYGLDKITAEVIQTSFICNDSAFTADTAYVQTPTAVNNVTAQGGISVYPNPVSNILAIQSSSFINSVSISNIVGQMVYKKEYNTQRADIDVAAFPTGVYFVKINEVYVQKVLKQ